MEDSILITTKKMLGYSAEDDAFDLDILVSLNSAIGNLTDAGIGPAEGFVVEGPQDKWTQLLGPDKRLSRAKTYIYTQVRILFDPPQLSSALEAMKAVAEEHLTRLSYLANYPQTPPLQTEAPL